MECIHLSKDFLLVFNVPEIMCLVFECSTPGESVSHSSSYHIPGGRWLMISLWTTWSFSFLCSARTISDPTEHFRVWLGSQCSRNILEMAIIQCHLLILSLGKFKCQGGMWGAEMGEATPRKEKVPFPAPKITIITVAHTTNWCF